MMIIVDLQFQRSAISLSTFLSPLSLFPSPSPSVFLIPKKPKCTYVKSDHFLEK
jgi:hypothetical protein